MWDKHEKPLELQTILEQGFVEDPMANGECLIRRKKATWSRCGVGR